MKHTLIFSAFLFSFAEISAQTSGIDAVLQQIEANNKELQANSHLISSQKLENKTNNNLPDPTLSYAHLGTPRTVTRQSAKWSSRKARLPHALRHPREDEPTQDECTGCASHCLPPADIAASEGSMPGHIMLQRQQALLDERLKNAEELSAMYTRRLETGDANVLETNKIIWSAECAHGSPHEPDGT